MDPNMLWYFQELYKRMGWLGERQLKLEQQLADIQGQLQSVGQQLQSLGQSLSGLEDRPATRIDKIEYHFEQLKVDTLAGTLQIGAAHGAQGVIDELGIQQSTAQDVKLGAAEPDDRFVRLAAKLQAYTDTELRGDIDEASSLAGAEVDPELRERMAEDLAKQVHERLILYMKEIPAKGGPDESAETAILEKIRGDVRTGLKQYFEGFGKEQAR